MKRFILALVLFAASVIAFAAPSPKQIEAALAARDYASAKTMISQVLAERPDSARAHLMKAYVLAAADKNKEAAKAELAIAKTLDTKGDVVNSPLFGRTVGAIDNIQVAAPPPRVAPPAQAAPATYVAPAKPAPVAKQEGSSTGFWIFMAMLLACGVGTIVYVIARRKPEMVSDSGGIDLSKTYSSTPSPDPAPSPYRSAAAPAYRDTAPVYRDREYYGSNSGMGTGAAVATGAVAGVAGALVVDNMIENARLRDRVNSLERDRNYSSGSNNSWAPTPAPAPVFENPPIESRVDYESEAQSFSSSSTKSDAWAPSPSPAPAPAEDTWSSGSTDSWSSAPADPPASSDTW